MLKGVMRGIPSSYIKGKIDFAGLQGGNCKAGTVKWGKTYELGQRPVYFTHVVTDLDDYDWRILMALWWNQNHNLVVAHGHYNW